MGTYLIHFTLSFFFSTMVIAIEKQVRDYRERLRNAVIEYQCSNSNKIDIAIEYNVHCRNLRTVIHHLTEHEKKKKVKLRHNKNELSMFRWVSNHLDLPPKRSEKHYTEEELKVCAFEFMTNQVKDYRTATKRYGVPKQTLIRYCNNILPQMKKPC